jgi:hypothetical protein
VNFVALFEKELGEVGSVLASDAGDECFFHGDRRVICYWLFVIGEEEEVNI